MVRTSWFLGWLLLTVSACAGPTGRPAPSAAAPARPGVRASDADRDTMLVCEMERPTGSNIPERVCRRASDAEMERLRTQDAIRTLPNPQARKGQ